MYVIKLTGSFYLEPPDADGESVWGGVQARLGPIPVLEDRRRRSHTVRGTHLVPKEKPASMSNGGNYVTI